MTGDSVRRLCDAPSALLAIACGAAVTPLLFVRYLPMIDLPQHAAQVAIWQHLDDPAFGFSGHFELEWHSPYLLGYVLCRALASVVTIQVAVRIVVAVAVVALPAAVDRLLIRTGGDRTWAIACLPLAFGFAFHWGFLNFMIAVPIGIYVIARAVQHAHAPSLRGGVLLGVLAILLYFAHLAVFAFSAAVSVAILCATAPTVRAAVARTVTMAVPIPLGLAWSSTAIAQDGPYAGAGTTWDWSAHRFVELFRFMLGTRYDRPAGIVAVLLVASVLYGARLQIGRWRWIPAAASTAAFAFGPSFVLLTALVYHRFAVFVLPMSLVALAPHPDERRRRRSRAAVVALVMAWLCVLAWRFVGFDAEAREIDPILAQMERGQRVWGVVLDPTSAYVPHTPFDEFEAWYQVEKGGRVLDTFAVLPVALARATSDRRLRGDSSHVTREYDYLLVRSSTDPTETLVSAELQPGVPLARSGAWWLFAGGSWRSERIQLQPPR